MEHCVGTYALQASRGDCFLFHIDHAGETATVEVSPRGHVLQACGPKNCQNLATEWGAKVLSAWAAEFRAAQTPLPNAEMFENLPF